MRKALPVFIAVCLVLSLFTGVFAPVPEAKADGPARVVLGTAGNFVILAKSGISTTGTSSITGDIGVSPAAATLITGFGTLPFGDSSHTFSTSSQVTGKVYASDYTPPTPANMTTAVSNMEAAYTDAATRTPGTGATNLNVGGGFLSGLNFSPGTYTWNTPGNVTITGDITLTGGANDVWIFQIKGTLDLATGKNIFLAGGALAKNIFWQVAGAVSLLADSHFEGNILAKTNIALENGASINGRLLAQTAVTLIGNTVGVSSAELPGTITVIKDTVPNGPQDFNFTIADSVYTTTFSLDDDLDDTLSNTQVVGDLLPGTYTITEAATAGYTLANIGTISSDLYATITSDLYARRVIIMLDAGGSATATFTNNIIPPAPAPTPAPVPVPVPVPTNTVYHQTFFIGYPDGLFKPERNVSRAEVAAALTRVLGLGWSNTAPSYPDVPATHWAAGNIQIMKDEGIMIGDVSGTFRPDAFITRAEAATALLRMLKVAPIQNLTASSFKDVPVTNWAVGYIEAMQKNGYIIGYPDGTYKPTVNILRSEFTAIADRTLGREISKSSQVTGLGGGVLWPDVPVGHWAYLYILEASTPHTVANAVKLDRTIVLKSKTIPLFSDGTSIVTIHKAGDVLTAIVPVDGLLPDKFVPAARQVTVAITIKIVP